MLRHVETTARARNARHIYLGVLDANPVSYTHLDVYKRQTLAYSAADAGFVQPFDDLKLFSNIAVSWIVLNFAPEGSYWLGMALILAGSGYLLWSERQNQNALQPA